MGSSPLQRLRSKKLANGCPGDEWIEQAEEEEVAQIVGNGWCLLSGCCVGKKSCANINRNEAGNGRDWLLP